MNDSRRKEQVNGPDVRVENGWKEKKIEEVKTKRATYGTEGKTNDRVE